MSKPNFKPWRFVGQGILIDDDENEIVLGNVYSDDQIGWLIAAAPDLYEALKACLGSFGLVHAHKKLTTAPDGGIVCACDLARAALAKAEGR
jgi:hypothetical protein